MSARISSHLQGRSNQMPSRLPPQLNEFVIQHLQNEESVLQRIEDFFLSLTDQGFGVPALVQRQAGLASLMEEVILVQEQRQNLCQTLSQLWNRDSSSIRLSQIDFGSPGANETFQRRREKLTQLAIRTRTRLSTAEQTLRGWSGIINFVLEELLGSSGISDRYSATGQRLPSTRLCSIDVRS